MMRSYYFANTDTVSIENASIGLHSSFGYVNRGLTIEIKHNRVPGLYHAACEMAFIIQEALNEAIKSGKLQLP